MPNGNRDVSELLLIKKKGVLTCQHSQSEVRRLLRVHLSLLLTEMPQFSFKSLHIQKSA